MKRFEELLIGVLLFYIVDRGSRALSAYMSDHDDMQTERFRCTVETTALVTIFVILWLRLKR